MGRPLDPKKVKSAQRALEVLEYFKNGRTEATVMDISRSMGYPQSSTSELLACLVTLGYLTKDNKARTYRPTARVAVLGASVQPALFSEGQLLPVMTRLADDADATVILGNRVGLDVQYIHMVSPEGAYDDEASAYGSAPLTQSAMGKAVLAAMDHNSMRGLVHRLNAECTSDQRVAFDQLEQECIEIDAQGYAFMKDERGRWLIAMLISHPDHDKSLVLGLLVGKDCEDDEQRDNYVQLLRGAVARLSAPKSAQTPLASPAIRSTTHAALQLAG